MNDVSALFSASAPGEGVRKDENEAAADGHVLLAQEDHQRDPRKAQVCAHEIASDFYRIL